MKVAEYKRMNRGDVPGMPEPFYKFMDHSEEQMELLSQASNARLTVAENFLAEPIRAITMRDGLWSVLKLSTLKTAPAGVLVLRSDIAVTAFQWQKIDQDRIQVRALFEGTPADPVKVSLEIRG